MKNICDGVFWLVKLQAGSISLGFFNNFYYTVKTALATVTVIQII